MFRYTSWARNWINIMENKTFGTCLQGVLQVLHCQRLLPGLPELDEPAAGAVSSLPLGQLSQHQLLQAGRAAAVYMRRFVLVSAKYPPVKYVFETVSLPGSDSPMAS